VLVPRGPRLGGPTWLRQGSLPRHYESVGTLTVPLQPRARELQVSLTVLGQDRHFHYRPYGLVGRAGFQFLLDDPLPAGSAVQFDLEGRLVLGEVTGSQAEDGHYVVSVKVCHTLEASRIAGLSEEWQAVCGLAPAGVNGRAGPTLHREGADSTLGVVPEPVSDVGWF